MSIFISNDEEGYHFDVTPETTILDLFEEGAEAKFKTHVLTFQGEPLNDPEALLSDLGICPESTLYMKPRHVKYYRHDIHGAGLAGNCLDFKIIDYDRSELIDICLNYNFTKTRVSISAAKFTMVSDDLLQTSESWQFNTASCTEIAKLPYGVNQYNRAIYRECSSVDLSRGCVLTDKTSDLQKKYDVKMPPSQP